MANEQMIDAEALEGAIKWAESTPGLAPTPFNVLIDAAKAHLRTLPRKVSIRIGRKGAAFSIFVNAMVQPDGRIEMIDAYTPEPGDTLTLTLPA